MPRICLFLMAALSSCAAWSAEISAAFPRPPELEADVAFWTHIYTEVDTKSGLIHDSRHLEIVYEAVDFSERASKRSRNRKVKKAKERYRAILRKLAKGQRSRLNAEEQRVLSLWPEDVSNRELRDAARRLRFQLGQSDKFRAGLIRSGAWEPHIRQTLMDKGLPMELAALPHVESSFNPAAYSHVGAAGLWQFTRSTGRRYMRIDHVIDERMDPFMATEAAAQLLQHNHSVTGTWPLALTAYNHGVAGMRRAKRKLGTDDIVAIVRRYKSRTFGFASRNFYVAFLAAVEVDFHAEKYFGSLVRDPEVAYQLVSVPDYMTVASLGNALGIDPATLKRHNPALRPSVWNGSKFVPRGFELRVPARQVDSGAALLLAAIPAGQRFAAQKPDVYHRVQRGDTLSTIATRYGVSQRELASLNGLRNRHYIRVGQVLRLPVPDTSMPLPDSGIYVVRRGDSISRIAQRFGVDEQSLLAANALGNKNLIYPGQTLRVAMTAETDRAGSVATPRSQPAEPESKAVAEAELASVSPARAEPEAAVLADELAEASTPADTEPDAVAATDVGAEETFVAVAMTPAIVSEISGPVVTEDHLVAVEAAEPTSAEEAAALGPTILAGMHSALSADPSDYTVATDRTIEVQAVETLGHYADWLEVRTQRLRDINGLRFGKAVVVGTRLKLDFSRIDVVTFEGRRQAYHRSMQESFFDEFQITGTEVHVIRRGESLWVLAQRRYKVPIWLLRQYNPDLDLDKVRPGVKVTIPLLREATAPTIA